MLDLLYLGKKTVAAFCMCASEVKGRPASYTVKMYFLYIICAHAVSLTPLHAHGTCTYSHADGTVRDLILLTSSDNMLAITVELSGTDDIVC